MEIIYRTGDVLDAPSPYILHGCNAKGEMNTGAAKAIKDRYPLACDVYAERHKQIPLQLGEIIVVPCGTHTIINGITQDAFGYDGALYLDYAALVKVIQNVDQYIRNRHFEIAGGVEVAMPRIGSDRAGGDWQLISQIIENHSQNFKPVVYSLPVACFTQGAEEVATSE